MMMASVHPRRYPASSPRTVPRVELIATAASATAIETRPPTKTRVSVSRPRLSVPSGCSRLGVCLASTRFMAYGSYGETYGVSKAAKPMNARKMRLIKAARCRTNRDQKPGPRANFVERMRLRAALLRGRQCSSEANPGIDQTIGEIGNEAADNDQDRHRHGDRENQRIVLVVGCIEGQQIRARATGIRSRSRWRR